MAPQSNDKRLMEDYLPIREISAEASREKSVRKGHISTLHLWWARRPLVACRAAVYAALVPADQFQPGNGPDNKRASLGRANAQKFLTRLCRYPGDPEVIAKARHHILEAHRQRLIQAGEIPPDTPLEQVPPPKVLDMFAGGGAIPLEALRLGCKAHAVELNPVAHIIELCTLVYPQKYGKPDPSVRGMTGPPGKEGQLTWGGLAKEVEYWGNWVIEQAKELVGDLYPPIPDPEYKGKPPEIEFVDGEWVEKGAAETGERRLLEEPDQKPGAKRKGQSVPRGYLVPLAYLWTRTVKCKNPACGAQVPLVRQTWLCRKKGRYIALRMTADPGQNQVRFEVVQSAIQDGLDFDPGAFSRGGNAVCPFCGTAVDLEYVKDEGWNGRMGLQPMAVVCARPGAKRKVYLAAEQVASYLPKPEALEDRVQDLGARTGVSVPSEPIAGLARDRRENTLGITVRPYGLRTFGDLFAPRQLAYMLALVATVQQACAEMRSNGLDDDTVRAIAAYLGILVDRQADYCCTLATWQMEFVAHGLPRQAIPMVWDFAELSPFGGASGSIASALDWITAVIRQESGSGEPAEVVRGSALALPWSDETFDAVITDPPYYDNVPYADISDFFYVWLKRALGDLFPEHFSGPGTPKKSEIVADALRHGGDKDRAKRAYEEMMAGAFAEAHRVLRPGGLLAVVYAHKTTVGWATLVNALRDAGFVVTEAWPLATERSARLRTLESAALTSSIFMVTRKRETEEVGSYEEEVRPLLESIVRERVDSLWERGIVGADLDMAAVGAGLQAYTKYRRVERANGEPVSADQFITEVEGLVQEVMLEKILGVPSSGVATVDAATRFYILWRFTYGLREVSGGEAIVFAYPQGVELDGPSGLSQGSAALLKKEKGKYRLLDFTQRGRNDRLGLPDEEGTPAPLIDVLHRTLWLMENRLGLLNEFLDEAHPDTERLRVIAQALAGPGLEGGQQALTSEPATERAALRKLLQHWKGLMEERTLFR